MTELIGYNRKIAYINLTEKKVEIKDLDENIAREYLGGVGLSAKLMYDMLTAKNYEKLKENPFDPSNPLIFATGPVTGTSRPSSGRYSVCGVSPLTNIWGESTSGGQFCIALRNSGYDALVFTGKSTKPIYVYIENSEFRFKDASNIWGKDTYATQDSIKSELQSERVKIACCGQAGEKLVRYACVINDDGRAAGRTGMGAVMGSKNFKALAIAPSAPVVVASPKEITEHRKKINYVMEEDLVTRITTKVFQLYGTNSYMDMGMFSGDVPAKYFTETEFPAELLTTKTIKEQYPCFITGCAGCTLKCAKQTEVEHNGKKILVDGPEYESMAAYGSLMGIFDPKYPILAHHYGNVYGIDTISSGVSIAFLIYLVENNLAFRQIKRRLKNLVIEELHWGNSGLPLKLLKLIAERKGIGDLLADGVKRMAEVLGVDPELAAHVKGMEIPMHDPRANAGQALSYMTACVGPNHQKCDWFQVEAQVIIFPEYGVIPGDDKGDITGREKGVAVFQDIRGIDDSAINCQFETPPKVSDYAKYISLATGYRYSPNDIVIMGERMTNLKRVISCNLGLTREDDKLPKIVLNVFESGPTAGVKLQLDENLKNYYKHRGWDWNTGRPTFKKLQELGILEGGEQIQSSKKNTGLSEEELKELDQLQENYLPLVLNSTLKPEDIFNYLRFVCLLGRKDQDFQDEFGGVEDNFRLSILDVPEDQWYWMKLDRGYFEIGRGNIEKPTLELIFKTEKAFMGVMNRTINPVAAVISGKLKVKPINKVRIFQNFMQLYMDKFGLKF